MRFHRTINLGQEQISETGTPNLILLTQKPRSFYNNNYLKALRIVEKTSYNELWVKYKTPLHSKTCILAWKNKKKM